MKCEICKAEPATSLSLFSYDDRPDQLHKEDPWKWAGNCSRDNELYYIMIDDISTQKEATRWYHHLQGKTWFGPVSEHSFLSKLDDFQARLSEKVFR